MKYPRNIRCVVINKLFATKSNMDLLSFDITYNPISIGILITITNTVRITSIYAELIYLPIDVLPHLLRDCVSI